MWDQVLVGAEVGDAITRNALLINQGLRSFGEADIFAEHIGQELEGPFRPIDELAHRRNADRPLIFHTSMGSWPVYRAVVDSGSRLIVIHHNFSPPEYYVDFAPDVASDLVRGRWELQELRDRVDLAIADSVCNAEQLHGLGYPDVTVIAPTPDVDRLNHVVPDPATLGLISSWGPGPLVLCVAQLLPHKRIERVMAAVSVLQQEHQPDAQLVIVGGNRFPAYTRSLDLMARTLGLRNLHFPGRITDEALSAYYLRARVFLTLSEHEGFCIPVVEAMATGVPVVAAARAAIPDTVADAGLLVDDPDDPVLVAGVLQQALTDERLRHILVGRGVSRAKRLSAAASLPQVVRAIAATAGLDAPQAADPGVEEPVA